jgi:glucose-6-phosphate 1-dehydrogenase
LRKCLRGIGLIGDGVASYKRITSANGLARVPTTIVIFGASGDLAHRKLVPALYQSFRKGRLPKETRVVGFSRTPMSHADWRQGLAESARQHLASAFEAATWDRFAESVFYHVGDIEQPDDFSELRRYLEQLESAAGDRVYYLATAPQFFAPAIRGLGAAGLADEAAGVRRIVVEKPFGTDHDSARRLNETLHAIFRERQVYRIDHYLGKETVQNILVLRMANTIFEPVWNRNYIDHVQITAAEDGRVGRRGAYYDRAGVLRDMFQNHLLQLLTFTAMEPPSRLSADAVRNEKVKVLDAVRPQSQEEIARDTLRAQYRGYREESATAPDSQTATFAAIKLHVDNWRWQGVPFYLRSGKALSCRTTQIVIQFRQPPHLLFDAARQRPLEANRLVLHIQPAEGIQLHFQTKVPDAGMDLRLTDLDFRFDERFDRALPEAYERLLLDVLQGDASLFARSDEVELAWGIIDPIARAWEQTGTPPLCYYEPGVWGPEECCAWMERDGRQWLDACPVLRGPAPPA